MSETKGARLQRLIEELEAERDQAVAKLEETRDHDLMLNKVEILQARVSALEAALGEISRLCECGQQFRAASALSDTQPGGEA